MVRERIVADAAALFLVLVDAPKVVAGLDDWGVLPIAVVPFGAGRVLEELGGVGATRRPGRNDDGLVIIDLRVPAGTDWEALAARADGLAGVVDHGLFRVPLGHVLVGRPDGGCDPAG